MKIPMPFAKKLASALAASAMAAAALAGSVPAAHAAQGDVLGVSFRDLDHNGRIERAVISVANPGHQSLAVTSVADLKVSYGGKALTPTAAYVAGSGDPATLVVIWNQNDAGLPLDTSVSQFAVEWPTFGVTKDSKKIDQAAPILLSSSPVPGALSVDVSQPIVLNFSEPIAAGSLMWQAVADVAGWAVTWSAGARTATLTHVSYAVSTPVTFTVTQASDAAGNAVVPGSATLNPFRFTISNSTLSNPGAIDPVFALNEPRTGSVITAGQPTVISWYANQPLVTQARLSWSVNGGTTYLPLGVFPISQGSTVWYPPSTPTSFILKLEGLTAAGAVSAIDVHNTLMLSAGSGAVTLGDEQTPPALPVASAPPASQAPPTNGGTVPPPADVTPPQIVGSPVVDTFDPKTKTAVLHFTTDEPTSVTVYYGLRKNYSKLASDGMTATDHVIALKGLAVGAMHNLRISMTDAAGNGAGTKDVFFQFLREGDRIKGSGPAVYWYKDGQKQLFLNQAAYFAHFRSWSGIITIGDTQLGNLPDGPAVAK